MKQKLFTLLTLVLCVCTGAWADNVYKYQLNGANKEIINKTETDGDMTYFSYNSSKHNFNAKFTGCTYDGVSYTSGLKMEGATNISWTSTATSTVIIVQSTWSGNTIKFDGTELAVTDAEAITGGRIYTIGNVTAGEHSVTRGSGESGIFAVYVTEEGSATYPIISASNATIFPTESNVEKTCEVNVTGTNLTGSTLTAELGDDAPAGMSVDLDENTISEGSISATATISYTTTKNASGRTTLTFSDGKTSKSVTIIYNAHVVPYTEQGSILYYSKNGTEAEGTKTNTITTNGITATMVDNNKTFQYGAGSVIIGENTYVPLKLSTGSSVNVTFPTGKVATKVIVYGWSADGNGAINSIKESATANNAIDTSGDIFYAKNTESDLHPSVYEYTLDDWESFYFNPGGSASQPFVVMEFVLTDAPIVILPTETKAGYSCNGSTTTVDRNTAPLNGQTVYEVSTSNGITITVPATTSVSRITVRGTSGENAGSTITIKGANTESKSLDLNNRDDKIKELVFTPETQTTTYTITSATKKSWLIIEIYGEELVLTPKKQYTTLTSAYNLDFTNVDGLNAYIVKEDGVFESTVTLTQVNKVPAGTGLVLKGTPNTKYTLATYEGNGDDISDNKMVGSATAETTPATGAAYILSDGAFHPWNGEGNIAAGKAYLNVNSAGAKALSINFSDFTGISNAEANEASKTDSDKMYNLSGQTVGEGYKGIVIVNGKKVIK